MGAIFNLNHTPDYLSWHFIQVSLSNLIVVVVMFAVFAAAIFVRFPHHDDEGDS